MTRLILGHCFLWPHLYLVFLSGGIAFVLRGGRLRSRWQATIARRGRLLDVAVRPRDHHCSGFGQLNGHFT